MQDFSDSICLLSFLFLGEPSVLPCGNGGQTDTGNVTLLDANGDGLVDFTDAIIQLSFLFLGTETPVLCRPGFNPPCFCQEIPGCAADRCDILLDVSTDPNMVDFGDVFVGSTVSQTLVVGNSGTGDVSGSLSSMGDGFTIVTFPAEFELEPFSGQTRNFDIAFSPDMTGECTGQISISSNASPVTVEVVGQGVLPVTEEPDIQTQPSFEFGSVIEGESAEGDITVENTGDAPLVVDLASVADGIFFVTSSAGFEVPLSGDDDPLVINAGESRVIRVGFAAPIDGAGNTYRDVLSILSNDPDEDPKEVTLVGQAVSPDPVLPDEVHSVLGALVTGNEVTVLTCPAVDGEVQFGPNSLGSDTFIVTIIDQTQSSVSSGELNASSGSGTVPFSGIDATSLVDDILIVEVHVARTGG